MNLNQQIEQWLNGHVKSLAERERPFVTLCYAQAWDGSITIRAGESLALSGEESTRLTHHLRSLHDGILVGVGTVLSDNPQLTVRQWQGPSPQPIVLDSHLRIPATARLCHLSEKQCWVLTSEQAPAIGDEGLEVITLDGDENGRVCLHRAMNALWHRGIRSLMVEGGANVITAFLRERLADAVVLTVAPLLVGGYKAVNELGFADKASLPRISGMRCHTLGEDIIVWGELRYGESS